MNQNERNLERIQTRIEIIRTESRQVSYKIEALMERRKELQVQKKKLKTLAESYAEECQSA